MAERSWEQKEVAYNAKHNAYVESWKAKDEAFKKKEKAEIAAHYKANELAMDSLRKETIEMGRAHVAAVSAFNETLGKY